MKRTIFLLLIFISSVAQADPGRRKARKIERKKARVEREYAYKLQHYDQRTADERRKDRNVLVFILMGTGLIIGAMTRPE